MRHTRRLPGLLHGALLAGALLPPAAGAAQDVPDVDVPAVQSALVPEIRRAMLEGDIPALSIALVAGDEVVWSSALGESNLRARTPATSRTVYIIASTLKTMATTALLQLMEEEGIGLDDPIRDHAGELELPEADPDRPITFRHILTHTSGLPTVFSPVPVWADTVPTPMDQYLRERLEVRGPPGERVRYSNMGFTLLAHLVERISGDDFRKLLHGRIFGPVGMESTDFAPTPEMEERLAVPYSPDDRSGRLAPAARVRFAEWPAGGAWGTVLDQARWLIANLNGGRIDGYRILSEELLEEAHTLQFEEFKGTMAGGWGDGNAGYGLGWWVTARDGERYIAHSGSVRGYTAFLHGNRDRRLGVAILTNGHRAHPHLVRLAFLATDLMAEHSVAGAEGR